MKIIDVKQNTDEWFELRKCKITGSRLKDLVAKRGGRKLGFYELLADRLAVNPDDENAMDRGHRLEEEAIAHFMSTTGKEVVQTGIWISDTNDKIAVSPDGAIKNGSVYPEAVEVKCLSSARHLQALVENKIPDEYQLQVLQYFIVNEFLQTLYFVFYTDRIPSQPMHVIEVDRKDIEDDIEFYYNYEVDTLKEIDELAEKLAF